jgi:hypothetical protein
MKLLLNDIRAEKPAGFMIPIPQYPLYSATISEYDSFPVCILIIKSFSIYNLTIL